MHPSQNALFRPDVPFDPKRVPFFYGWWILVVATLGIVMSIPGQTMGVSVFTDPLIEVTGLSRLELSTTYLVGTLGSSLLLPRGGAVLDRLGSRACTVAACVVMAATLCLFSRIDYVAAFAARAVGVSNAAAAAAVALTLGFTLLRFSGQGMLTMASRTMLAKWFERRRGLASGIAGVFIAFGFASAPPVLQALIDLGDWRSAWLGLAAATGIGMTTVAWLFFRDNPEECGLRMDGRAPDAEEHAAHDGQTTSPMTEEPAATRGQALRTAGFWWVTIALSMQAMVYTGVTFHIVDLGNETGIGGEAAVKLFLPIAAVSTCMGLLSGWAADRVSVKSLVVVFLLAQSSGFVGAGQLGDPRFAALMVVGWGVASGLYGTIVSVALPNFFGRRHLGAISSVQMSAMVAGSAIGPFLLALAQTYLDSYRAGLLLCCGLSLASMLFALLAPTPKLTGAHSGGP